MWIFGCHGLIQLSTEVIVEPNAEIYKVSLLFLSDLFTCTKIPVGLQPSCILSAYVHLNIPTFSIVAVFLGNLSYWHVAFIFNSVCMILHKCMESCIRCLHKGCLLHSEVTVGFWSTSCYVSAVKWYIWKLVGLAFLCRFLAEMDTFPTKNHFRCRKFHHWGRSGNIKVV